MENSPNTLYPMIGRETVRKALTKNKDMKGHLQEKIDWMIKAVIRILEANKQ